MSVRRRHIPIRFAISTAFVLLFTITVLTIVLYSYWANTRSMRRVAGDLLEQHTALAVAKTIDYLDPASAATDFSAQLYNQAILDIGDHPRFKELCVQLLHRYPQFVLFNYGNQLGNIYGAERGADGQTIAFQTTRETPQTEIGTYVKTFLDREGNPVKVEQEPTPFDPRVRPWYQGAIAADGGYWGGAYVLVTDRQQIAISVSYPIRDPSGRLVGVLGGDLGIREISVFLHNMRVGQRGFVMLLDEADRVLAYPDFDKALAGSGAEQHLRHVGELDLPWVEAALREHEASGKLEIDVDRDGARQIVAIRPFPASFGKQWKIVLTVPEDDFVGAIKKTNRVSLLLSLAVLLASVLLVATIAGRVSRPILSLTAEANRIRELELEGDIAGESSIKEIHEIYSAMGRMKTGMRAFLKYLPAALVKQLVDSGADVELGGHRRQLTVLFTDVKGFTSISEGMSSEALMSHLSRYFDELTRVIMDNGGTVDKYIGDAIMAFWGAPRRCEDHAYLACRAAVRCQQALSRLHDEWTAAGLPAMPTRIGLHTDDCVVGNVGSSDRMNYTVLGDGVNLASRLEGVNKVYGTGIILSDATHALVADRVLARHLDLVIVKGRSQPTPILELVALLEDQPEQAVRDRVAAYNRAFQAYLDGEWEQALTELERLPDASGAGDPVVDGLMERCRTLRDSPPEDDSWRYTQLSSK